MAEQTKPAPQANAPYEEALKIALNKLTFEVFIFLIAYTILLIGIGVFASGLSTELRTLLYIIPILGVAAYIWIRRRNIAKRVAGDVSVGSIIARRGSEITGVRGSGPQEGNTRVGSLFASDSRITGRDHGGIADAADVRYLVDIFEKLPEAGRNELMANALEIRKKQEQSNA